MQALTESLAASLAALPAPAVLRADASTRAALGDAVAAVPLPGAGAGPTTWPTRCITFRHGPGRPQA